MSAAMRDPRAGHDAVALPTKIALVGLRGSGKSSVGALLARELARPFVDLDLEIEQLAAREQLVSRERPASGEQRASHEQPASCERPGADRQADPGSPLRAGELLARLGEDRFRDVEARALEAVLARREPLVLACGGGVVLRETNRAKLRASAWVIWLDAPPEELERRLRADPTPRPSLTGAGMLEDLRATAAARRESYEEVAALRIRTEGLAPGEVVRLLRGGLGGLGGWGGPGGLGPSPGT